MAGRPRIYNTPEEMEAGINAYFKSTPIEQQTVTGLALYLGFESKQSMYDYQEREEFSYLIKLARTRVEHSYELTLRDKERATGSIFALKNMGWADKQIHEVSQTKRLIMTNDDGSAINPQDTDL